MQPLVHRERRAQAHARLGGEYLHVRTDDRGKVIAVGCNPGHYPIWLLSQETQLAVYQHFKKPTEARDLFLSLADAKTYNDRLDEHDQDKGHLIVDALEEWEAAGFPGTWKEWGERGTRSTSRSTRSG